MIGLTGNYGMGKSTVLKMFQEMGAVTIDTDDIVHRLLEEEDTLNKIRQVLGDRVFDSRGRLLKDSVSDIIFKNSSLRHEIEDIIHPLVFKALEGITQGMEGVVIVEAPLIFERGYEARFKNVITVYTDEETALRRLEASGIKREDALKRLSCQMPIAEKIKKSDYVIDGSLSLDKTRAQAEGIYEELAKL